MESDYAPLDPRPNAVDITELHNLTMAEVKIGIPKIDQSDADTLAFSGESLIIDQMDYKNFPMTGAFCVGDRILKVNDDVPQSPEHFKQIMTDLSPCSVTVSRRAFVVAPRERRLRDSLDAMGLPYAKGCSYQVVVCKKEAGDRFPRQFGFVAEPARTPDGSKFIIGEIAPNTAAEKYFAVGDALIDIRDIPYKPPMPAQNLTLFNAIFAMGVEMEVLVERPVTEEARLHYQYFIRKHLCLHAPMPMNEDAVSIGINAALYHRKFWSRLDAVSILVRPPPDNAVVEKKPKKNFMDMIRFKKSTKEVPAETAHREEDGAKKSINTKEDATATEITDGEATSISFDDTQTFEEISTDVEEGTELWPTGHRFWEDGEEADEGWVEEMLAEMKDEEEKKKAAADTAAAPEKLAAAAADAAEAIPAAPPVARRVVVPIKKKIVPEKPAAAAADAAGRRRVVVVPIVKKPVPEKPAAGAAAPRRGEVVQYVQKDPKKKKLGLFSLLPLFFRPKK